MTRAQHIIEGYGNGMSKGFAEAGAARICR
jgi:hypothetical protein